MAPKPINDRPINRIKKELEEFKNTAPPGLSAGPINDQDLFRWEAMLIGPEGSPYEGGVFFLEVSHIFMHQQVLELIDIFLIILDHVSE